MTTTKFRVKIFADGADRAGMLEMYLNPLVAGFTTNPTLMRKAGVTDYEGFARDILLIIRDKPISFEVFSDDFDEMELQAKQISSWGENVCVKIPITNTRGESSIPLVARLSPAGVKVNVTAMMTTKQVRDAIPALADGPGGYVSVFAGRIADSGRDPVPIMKEVLELLHSHNGVENHIQLIWASPREIFNLVQADQIGCHVITMTNDLLKKIPLIGKDLDEFSLETVKMFFDDAKAAGYSLHERVVSVRVVK